METTAGLDRDVDLVVIGAGCAGLATALFADIEGLSVVVIERSAFIGGTSALSAGSVWIPNSVHAAGSGDTPERAATFLRLAVANHSSEEMRQAFLEAGPRAVAVLEAQTELRFRARPLHPDYLQEVEGSSLGGRVLEPLPFDGGRLGQDLALIRPPIPEFTILGGMMVDRDDIGHLLGMGRSWAAFRHSMGLVAGHAAGRLRHGRGSRLVMGNALVGRLLLSLKQRGVPVLLDTRVEALLPGPAGVDGVEISQGDCRSRITARCGVVLATGGFNDHPLRRATLLRGTPAEHSPAAPGRTGGLHDMALGLGAQYGQGALDHAYWAPISTRRRRDGSMAVFPHFVLDRGKPGTVCVGPDGRRFVNEAVSYHLFARAMEQGGANPAFLVTDSDGLRRYGLGMVRPGGQRLGRFLADGYLVSAPTPAALAEKLGVDPAGLEGTIAAMNGYAETGLDTEFGRGATAYHRVNGDAGRGLPNPNLGPIGQPPFYALRLYPGDIGAATGLLTDTEARVLDAERRPVGGLYACGNDMQSVMGGVYPGPGITLGPALAFAWRAARAASRQGRAV